MESLAARGSSYWWAGKPARRNLASTASGSRVGETKYRADSLLFNSIQFTASG